MFRAYTARLKAGALATFERELLLDPKVFPEVYAVDGTRLERVARMLTVARKTTKAIISGSLDAVQGVWMISRHKRTAVKRRRLAVNAQLCSSVLSYGD